MLLLTAGCDNKSSATELPAENDEPVWVMTAQTSYDAYGNVRNRQSYQYRENQYNFRSETYNEHDKLTGFTEISQNEDGTEKITKHYLADGTEASVAVQTLRPDGKLLKEKTDIYDGRSHEQVWEWNRDGTKAEVYAVIDGQKQFVGTREYDKENRLICEKTDSSETVYTYEEGKTTLRSDMGLPYIYYVVRFYDEQGRLTETRDYKDFDGGSYTEDDLVSYGIQTYKEDGHSLVNKYYILDEVTGEELTGSVEVIYRPLAEVLAQ